MGFAIMKYGKIQTEKFPKKGHRKHRHEGKTLMRNGKLVNDGGHNHIRRNTIMQHQMHIHI